MFPQQSLLAQPIKNNIANDAPLYLLTMQMKLIMLMRLMKLSKVKKLLLKLPVKLFGGAVCKAVW